jgi:hypothetical protein
MKNKYSKGYKRKDYKNTTYKGEDVGKYGDVYRPQKDSGLPDQKETSSDSSYLNASSFKDLQKSGDINPPVDPETEASKGSKPYALLAQTNRVFDTSYGGEDNTRGNTMIQVSNSNTSKLLTTFDSGNIEILVNYLYLAMVNTDKNQAINTQMGKAYDDAFSKVASQITSELPFLKSTISCTTMPTVDENNRGIFATWYQAALQNLASIPSKFRQLMSLEQELLDMSYNRETAPLTSLFGLFKKAAFRAAINSLSTLTVGNYIDKDWLYQTNTLTMVPSRKSCSMRDPLLTVIATHKMPTGVTITDISEEEVFNSADYNIDVTLDGVTTNYTIETLTTQILRMFDQKNILEWARSLYNKTISTTYNEYYNEVKAYIDAFTSMMTPFSADVAEFNTVLEKMNQIGLNNWVKDITFNVDKIPEVPVTFNKLAYDIYKSCYANSSEMYYDNTTFKWKAFTVWDQFLGIPKFDNKQGGAFLAFSVRSIPDKTVDELYTDSKYLLPILFRVADAAEFVNRLGDVAELTFESLDSTEIDADDTLSRLNPLKLAEMSLKVPLLNLSAASGYPSNLISEGLRLMNTLFGYGRVSIDASNYTTVLNGDIVFLIDFEMVDITNAMINYTRAYSPFRVQTPDGKRVVGFITGQKMK